MDYYRSWLDLTRCVDTVFYWLGESRRESLYVHCVTQLVAGVVKYNKILQIMSLNMSFNTASPHVICPGNWFMFDRGFIMSVRLELHIV